MRRGAALLLAAACLTSVAWVATPMVLIWPFRAQTPSGVAVSHALLSRSVPVTTALLVLGAGAALLLWPRARGWKGRTLVGLALAALGVGVWLGHRNSFESMFRPLPHPRFAATDGAPDVADDDLVLGVVIGGQARAYPVRALGYHHLVNDVVAGEPIVATY